ncbi:MFS transporter [Candidatus Aerophobetes bacterium]|nr:MFS transporter [Candidatus Aerophobetes bacterium]
MSETTINQTLIKRVLLTKLGFFTICHGLVHLITESLAPLLPLIRNEFNLSYTMIGIFTLILSLTLGIASIPAGVISERINRFKFIALMFSLIGIICALLLPRNSFWITISLLTALYFCFSAFHPSAQICLFHEYASKRGATFGIYESGGNFGMFLAPILAGLVGPILGWRSVYGMWIIPAFIVAIFVFFASKKKGGNDFIYNSNKPIDVELFNWIKFILSHRELRTIFTIQGIAGLLWAMIVFIPLFLVDKRGFSVQNAGFTLALFLLAGAAGKVLGGKISDKWGRKKVIFFCFLLLAIFYPLIPIIYGYTLIFLLTALGITFFMIIPVLLASVGEFSKEGLGFNYGLFTLLGAGLSAISRLFSGIISDIWGMEIIFFVFASIAVAGAILSFYRLK